MLLFRRGYICAGDMKAHLILSATQIGKLKISTNSCLFYIQMNIVNCHKVFVLKEK